MGKIITELNYCMTNLMLWNKQNEMASLVISIQQKSSKSAHLSLLLNLIIIIILIKVYWISVDSTLNILSFIEVESSISNKEDSEEPNWNW